MGFLSNLFGTSQSGVNSQWSVVSKNLQQGFNSTGYMRMGENFYEGNYLCPECGYMMHKTVFPVGGEFSISTNKGQYNIKRIFTCGQCHLFCAPRPGHRGSEDPVIYKRFSNEQKYIEYFHKLDAAGTTQGRQDL